MKSPGKINTTKGGYLDDVDRFDAGFFEISPLEAIHMDPQQRLLLEVTYQAIEDGGCRLEDLSGTRTGVFVGISSHDYGDLTTTFTERTLIESTTNTGNSTSIAANRISYFFNLRGPSFSIDTACSSSMYALHAACRSLWSGESELAFACGVNLILKPELHIGFTKGGFLSPDGRCQPFDARANGYVRSEGVGAVLLKPLSRAMNDGDDVYALILGSAANEDGRTTGLPMPNVEAQTALLRDAYRDAGVDPAEVAYVEAHGTGTQAGDVAEATAIGTVIGERKKASEQCLIGSVKGNIGHLEAAAGMAGMIKLALCLKKNVIPPTIHFKHPNPQIDFKRLHLQVPVEPVMWGAAGKQRIAGINSFGFGGANAHLVLQSPPRNSRKRRPEQRKKTEARTYLFTLSAKDDEGLKEAAADYIRFLRSTEAPLSDICFSTFTRRSAFDVRFCAPVKTKRETVAALSSFLARGENEKISIGRQPPPDNKKIVFVYSGQGPQWWGMGRELINRDQEFRRTVEEIDSILRAAGWLKREKSSLLKELLKDRKSSLIHLTKIAQPAIFALQVALTRVWQSLGVEPDAVVGHSIGEVAASYVSGALTLAEATRVVLQRSACQAKLEGSGGMLAVGLSQQDAHLKLLQFDKAYEKKIVIAVINGPKNVTLSGDVAALAAFSASLTEQQIFNRMLKINIPFHSAKMEEIRREFTGRLGKVKTGKTAIPFHSAVLSRIAQGKELTAAYWYKNLREPVHFFGAVKNILDAGYRTFLEISPHPILSAAVTDAAAVNKTRIKIAPALIRQQPEKERIMRSLSALCVWGYRVDSRSLFPEAAAYVKLPRYPFQRQSYWAVSGELTEKNRGVVPHPHLKDFRQAVKERNLLLWDVFLDPAVDAYLSHHVIQGMVVFPGAGYLELVLAAARLSLGDEVRFLQDINFTTPLFLSPKAPSVVRLEIQDGFNNFFISSKSGAAGADWTLHCQGRINTADAGFGFRSAERAFSEKSMKRVDDIAQLYKSFREGGLEYGEYFKALKELRYSDGQAVARIGLSADLEAANRRMNVHPVLIDACFQTLLAVALLRGNGAGGEKGLFLPVVIEYFRFHRKSTGAEFTCRAEIDPRDDNQVKGSIWLYDENGSLVFEIRGFQARHLPNAREKQEQEMRRWFYHYQWKLRENPRALAARDPGAFLTLPDHLAQKAKDDVVRICNDAKHREFIEVFAPRFNALCVDFVAHVLRELHLSLRKGASLNPAALLKKLRIAEKHERLFTNLFKILSDRGFLFRRGSRYEVIKEPKEIDPFAELDALLREFPDFRYVPMLLKRCGPHFIEVLRDQADGLSLLFPEGDWEFVEGFYSRSYSFLPYYELIRRTLPVLLDQVPTEKNLKILEIGAGTGGLTQVILPLLPADRTIYTFTDVSPFFLDKARRRFAGYDFIEYRIFDLDRDFEDQDFKPDSFDIVIAANVVHATKSIKTTLHALQRLLGSGGLLLLMEVTKPPLIIDLTFGMTKGWWSYEDTELRPDHAVLPYKKWLAVLKETGFTGTLAIRDTLHDEDSYHTVFYARNKVKRLDKAAPPPEPKAKQGRWLVYADPGGISRRLLLMLAHLKRQYLVLFPGDRFARLSENAWKINAEDQEHLRSITDSLAFPDSPPWEGILHLWNCDDHFSQATPPERLAAFQRAGSFSLVTLVKVLLDKKSPPPVWIVTNGTQVVERRDALENLAGAPVWGLARVLMNEQPQIRIRCVDLSRRPGARELQNLVSEIFTEHNQDEIAFRNKKRYAHKLERLADKNTLWEDGERVAASGTAYHVEMATPGVLDSLTLRRRPEGVLQPDQVRIAVKAAALNFRDIMLSMGLLTDEAIRGGFYGRNVGLECSGIVTEKGSRVKGIGVGEEVIALAPDSLSGSVVTTGEAVVRKPARLSFEQAATIPVVYMTSYYALHHLARLERGETVLVHAGAGGVGIAAIVQAKLMGARVIATAGTKTKRAFLRKMGVRYVFDSRSLDFKDRVLEATAGRGVDVILNSLSGKALHQNIACLAPFGRFVEIGKTDIYADTRIGLKPFGNNLSYFAVDLDRMLRQKPALSKKLFAEVMTLFEEKRLSPHPLKIFPVSRFKTAMRFLAQARHIGKVVLTMNDGPLAVLPPEKMSFKKNASYLVSGGASGFGLAVAAWLARQGAGCLLLVSRSGVKTAADQKIVDEIKAAGADVRVVRADITNERKVRELFRQIRESLPPLKGIVHAATVYDDTPAHLMSVEQFLRGLMPKMIGAWNLHRASRALRLDCFVNFSSVSSIYGNPGQANYAAGNSFLNQLAHFRRARGLPCVTINWGTLGQVGVVARNEKLANILESQGWGTFDLATALRVLETCLLENPVVRMAAIADWRKINTFFPHNAQSFRFKHLREEAEGNSVQTDAPTLKEKLARLSPEEAEETLAHELGQLVARVLGTTAGKVDLNKSLNRMGIDSLMSTQISNWIHTTLGVDYSLMKIMQGPTVNEIAADLASAVTGKRQAGLPAKPAKGKNERWLKVLNPSENPKVKLYCFSFVGRGVSVYHDLAAAADPAVQIVACQLPAREERIMEKGIKDLTALGEQLVTLMKEDDQSLPFALYGHCFGAYMCLFVTRLLKENKMKLPVHLFLSAARAPQTTNPLESVIREMGAYTEETITYEIIARFLRRVEWPDTIINNKEFVSEMRSALVADLAICNQMLEIKTHRPLAVPITVFAGKLDTLYTIPQLEAWREHTRAGFEMVTVPGGHMFINEQESLTRVAEVIARKLLD